MCFMCPLCTEADTLLCKICRVTLCTTTCAKSLLGKWRKKMGSYECIPFLFSCYY